MNYCKRPQDGQSEVRFEMIADTTWSIGLFKQAITPSTVKMCSPYSYCIALEEARAIWSNKLWVTALGALCGHLTCAYAPIPHDFWPGKPLVTKSSSNTPNERAIHCHQCGLSFLFSVLFFSTSADAVWAVCPGHHEKYGNTANRWGEKQEQKQPKPQKEPKQKTPPKTPKPM